MFDQEEFAIRCEWGEMGARALAPTSDVIAVVDVLSFCTSVDIATARGASVYPFRWRDDSARAYAQSLGAVLAGSAREDLSGYSLAPTSLMNIPNGTRLVLPSPNGSAISLAIDEVPVIAGCLRNARAVAAALAQIGPRISIIPAGEKWGDGSLRPAVEDLVGAGAIINGLPGARSPEAETAVATFLRFRKDIVSCLKQCGSGKELFEAGFGNDVELAGEFDASDCVPMLTQGAYVHRAA